ncbi:MAG: HAMP domain-containing histidine kinase [Treponema sp.]|nr:HAMP domain-containing histidine kinase [Treponema sp.]
MTIKKQFIILATAIIAIPITIVLINSIQHYLHSADRFLMDGSSRIRKFDSKDLSKKDLDSLIDTIKILPPDVEVGVITEDAKLVFCSIPGIDINNPKASEQLWLEISNTSNMFFYQFTTLKLSNKEVALITRVLRKNKDDLHKPKNPMATVFAFLVIFVTVLVFLLIIISRTIFKSIIQIENTTQSLAEGNLQKQVTTNPEKKHNEITSILESLEKMRVALLEEQERKNRFIMGISHDLRTPVAIIKGYTEAMSDGIISDKEEIQNTLKLINNKSSQLEDMINSLINFIKMDNTMIRETLVADSITSIIKKFADEAVLTSNVFKRNLFTDIRLDKDIKVPLNKQMVNRTFENLFSNAIRYTKENDNIWINSWYDNKAVFIEIKDSGIGIAQKDLKYIFDMFYRASNSRKEEGMGIGLSVVKNVLKIHGWKIDVKSKKNEGSSFTITIPYIEDQEENKKDD